MNITELIQKLEPGAEVEVFELDIRNITGTNLASDFIRFFNNVNEVQQALVWKGLAYEPYPISAEGFEMTSKGTLPRPQLTASNVTGIITGLMKGKEDLLGAKLTRRRTFARYLDAVNFPGGVNATADPTQSLPDDVYYVQRKMNEDRMVVKWELSSALDLEGEMLPGRIVTSTYCQWQYRNLEEGCPYVGTSYFDVNDAPVGSLALDVCSKSVKACKLRFGENAVLPWGGFPAVRMYRA